MARHHIVLNGCDDSTHFDIDLTPSEMAVVQRLMWRAEEQATGCQPTISVDPEPDEYSWCPKECML